MKTKFIVGILCLFLIASLTLAIAKPMVVRNLITATSGDIHPIFVPNSPIANGTYACGLLNNLETGVTFNCVKCAVVYNGGMGQIIKSCSTQAIDSMYCMCKVN